jgi:hypothetical protein
VENPPKEAFYLNPDHLSVIEKPFPPHLSPYFDPAGQHLPLSAGKQGNSLPQRPPGIGFANNCLPLIIQNRIKIYFLALQFPQKVY